MAGFLNSLQNGILGTEGQLQQVPRFSTQQSNLLNQNILPSIGPMLQQLQQQQGQGFAPIAQEATKRFQTQSIPSLAQRFGGMGQSRGGSDYLHALSSAEAGLQQGLGGLESQYNLQNQGQQQQLLMSLLGLGLQPQFENAFQPGNPGLLGNLFGGGGLSSLLSLLGIR